MSIIPVHSPWAPAAGWSVASSIPVISRKYSLRVCRSLSVPCTVSSCCMGWSPVILGWDAKTSLIMGLYFMVQLPRGYMRPELTP